MRSLEERYRLAAAATPPIAAWRTAGSAIDGYWVDATRFFFLATTFDAEADRIVETPSLFEVGSGRAYPLADRATLAAILSRASATIDDAALADASYDMPDAGHLAVMLGRRAWLLSLPDLAIVRDEEAPEAPQLYAPDGTRSIFVEGDDLYLRDRASGEHRALTTDGAPDMRYARPSETGVSALSYRRAPYPLGIWSPNSRWFVTHQIDEREVPELAIVQNVPSATGRPALHRFKFGMPEDPMPMAVLVAFDLETGRQVRSTPFPLTMFSPFTSGSVWFGTGDRLYYLRADRYTRRYDLVAIDLATGDERVVLSEESTDGYIDLHPIIATPPNVRTLDASGEVIWYSERDDWGHLYLYDAASGALKNQITRGAWQVRDIIHVDTDARRLIFTAGGMDPDGDSAARSLCEIGFDGEGLRVILAPAGIGDVAVRGARAIPIGQDRPFRPAYAPLSAAPDGAHIVVRLTDIISGAETRVVARSNGAGPIITQNDPAVLPKHPPMWLETVAADGVTPLRSALYLPSDFDPQHRYPLIDAIYPGPQSVALARSFGSRMAAQAQAIAELGFVVLVTDSRGIPFRARSVHQLGYRHQYEPQLADHVAVIAQLADRYPFVDGSRVGIVGSSAGGAATARAMFSYPDTFKAGVAFAGNHDSRHSTIWWLQRYVGPLSEADADEQDNAAHAGKLEGALFLVSADMDDNVHVSNTLRLANALIAENKDFDLLIVPNEGHILQVTSGYAQRRMWDFFVRHLLGLEPPRGFDLRYTTTQLSEMARANARDTAWG